MHASEWASRFNATMVTDLAFGFSDNMGWFTAATSLGLILTVLLKPFLDGMIVGTGRARTALGFGPLLQNGIIEYGRMFRVMLWSLVPYLIVAAVAGMTSHMAQKHAEHAVLESQADTFGSVLQLVALVIFVLMHAIVESARAAFIADTGLRSATRALWRGVRQLFFRRPLRTLLFYLIVTIVGMVIAAVLVMARIHTPAIGFVGILLAFVLTQLIVAVIGWMHTARLFALADMAVSPLDAEGRI